MSFLYIYKNYVVCFWAGYIKANDTRHPSSTATMYPNLYEDAERNFSLIMLLFVGKKEFNEHQFVNYGVEGEMRRFQK